MENTPTIGLFWGSDTGATDGIAEELQNLLGAELKIEAHEVHQVKPEDFAPYDYYILGLSTWYDGELQSDWDQFFEKFCEIDFTGKTVAIFGLGDQEGYAHWFVDGMGIIADQVVKAGGKMIGEWSAETYEYVESKAEVRKGIFYGLAIDEDCQPELTTGRVQEWSEQIIGEFKAAFETVSPA